MTPKYCIKLKKKSAKEIASFLIKKFNENKVNHLVEEFKKFGFSSRSLINDLENLFKFLVLLSYDRRPFSPYEIVWDRENPNSVFSILEENGLLNLSNILKTPEDELHKYLDKLRVKGLRLSYLDLGKRIKASKTLKEIASRVDKIMAQLRNLTSGYDVFVLHKMLDDIYGIGPTIASKFILYVVRCMGVGGINPSEYGDLALNLKDEWRISKWVKRLKDAGILEEVKRELRQDPFAFDYFWDLDRNFCSKRRCEECEL